jgi:hypothetical protein
MKVVNPMVKVESIDRYRLQMITVMLKQNAIDYAPIPRASIILSNQRAVTFRTEPQEPAGRALSANQQHFIIQGEGRADFLRRVNEIKIQQYLRYTTFIFPQLLAERAGPFVHAVSLGVLRFSKMDLLHLLLTKASSTTTCKGNQYFRYARSYCLAHTISDAYPPPLRRRLDI